MDSQEFRRWCACHQEIPSSRPKSLIMGVLNVTPDSFSDGGSYLKPQHAIPHALNMIAQGADIIDIGGESARPGARGVGLAEELDRVLPVIEKLRLETDVCLSIDTTKPMVMQEALAMGVTLINDITALRREESLKIVAKEKAIVCLMHMLGEPSSMQKAPQYSRDIIDDVSLFFKERVAACHKAGIMSKQLILDPGFGFGKELNHNLRLLKKISTFKSFGLPIMLGVSRKTSLGLILNKPVKERLIGGITMGVFGLLNGVSLLRTHDVNETMQAVTVLQAIQQQELVEKLAANA